MNGTLFERFKKIVSKPQFAKWYAIFAVAVLLVTTITWAILNASVQQSNADQLVDPLLFQDHSTFQQALFPAAHSFLLKWPLFIIISLMGYSAAAFITVTVVTVLATIGILAYLLYRIEKRYIIFGTICLALSSILLFVPTSPSPNVFLPVNMAMLTTRNLEYVLYILGVWLIVRALSIKQWRFWLGVVCLALLFATDKLFLAISVGGALISLAAYAAVRQRPLVTLAARWLFASVLAVIVTTGLFWLCAALKITTIVPDGGAGPYAFIQDAHEILKALKYLLLGILTNFGVPVPTSGLAGVGVVINGIALLGALFAVYSLIRLSFTRTGTHKPALTEPVKLTIVLIWSTLIAAAAFVFTNHYYPVDARYVTIGFFALCISAAAYAQKKKFKTIHAVGAGAMLCVGIIFGTISAVQNYHASNSAFADVNQRNTLVAQALSNHHVDVLLGDYWRVVPIKVNNNSHTAIMPLQNCTQPRATLSSSAWNLDLTTHSFAYLLSFDQSLTDFPACFLQDITKEYGKPNASVVISGDVRNPRELLLYYDKGKYASSPTAPAAANAQPATVVPITPDKLPYTSCSAPTIMNIVAHEDDDLLFMNPDLLHEINAGDCIRTVYVTAGDAGSNEFYWQNREQGAEAAYDLMFHSSEIWVQRIVEIADNSFITVANPRGNSRVSLIFMHLPDGGLQGKGFAASHNESLAKLLANKITHIHAIYSASSYSSTDIVTVLSKIMSIYDPTEIHTQATAPIDVKSQYQDHSDHVTVGEYAQKAFGEFKQQHDTSATLTFYMGYPIRSLTPNIPLPDLKEKQDAFLRYATHDSNVCQNVDACNKTPTYGSYLMREYSLPWKQ